MTLWNKKIPVQQRTYTISLNLEPAKAAPSLPRGEKGCPRSDAEAVFALEQITIFVMNWVNQFTSMQDAGVCLVEAVQIIQ